jgi:hypothetical protein
VVIRRLYSTGRSSIKPDFLGCKLDDTALTPAELLYPPSALAYGAGTGETEVSEWLRTTNRIGDYKASTHANNELRSVGKYFPDGLVRLSRR